MTTVATPAVTTPAPRARTGRRLPPKPDFASIEKAAGATADRRTMILALIGNMVFCWSNNESIFIYVLMILMDTDETAAAITFGTLNTTRARLDLVQRLAAARIRDRAVADELTALVERFNSCTRARNEFNHCMYSVNAQGEITHTHSMKIQEVRGRLRLGAIKKMDDERIAGMVATIGELKSINRDLWDFLPRLQSGVAQRQPIASEV